MISDEEKQLIECLQYEEDMEVCVNAAQDSGNPFFLKEYALTYNWDDGFDVPNAIADNECCDLGTALSLFWLAEAMCFYDGEIERDEYNGDWADFCQKLIDRLASGAYKPGPVGFRPEINKVAAYQYEKDGVPSIFYKEVAGV